MPYLPLGAQFIREKMLWEIALGMAGDPSIPYYGNRDISITVGNGSGERFTPSLRMAPGSPILSHAVARGELDLAFVNPSALLTQAYRGIGLYDSPLPVRVIASYPSWDRFVIAVHPRIGIRSLAELKAKPTPLRISIREDKTHSTRALIDQLLPLYGLDLAELDSWGGGLQLNGPPMDRRRLAELERGTLDVVFDEGIRGWLPTALRNGMRVLELEPEVMTKLVELGWRSAILPKARFPELDNDLRVIDYSGWPLYTRESLADDVAYAVCDAISQRASEIPWESDTFVGAHALGDDAEVTPRDVPLHPGAERWYREHAAIS
jgi:TRAP-type uncharacterized transport system substrate-binding protein